MYGGPDGTAYFVRETRKATWFTQVPVVLSRASGQPQFNQEWSVSISRAGDYLLYAWLRVTIPSVTLSTVTQYGTSPAVVSRLRWTRNLMHNLILECCITFNDLVAARFDNWHLDFWSAFTVPAGKRNGYNNMIGNFDELTMGVTNVGGVVGVIPGHTLNLPLPLFFSRDSGVALPTAALPYNDMRINFSFRDWNRLLITDRLSGVVVGTVYSNPSTLADLNGTAPQLGTVQVWANYAIVSNDERKRMACAPRDILIEQVQTAPVQSYAPLTNSQPTFDIRFSHAIKVLFFAVQNTSVSSQWSNYTSATPYPDPANTLASQGVEFSPSGASDPILATTLIYENTQRLAQMGSDYFSLVNPWYHAPVVALETGYHVYSYSLDFYCLDPMGSTNYGKLTNVSMIPQASAAATTGATGTSAVGTGQSFAQTFNYIVTAVNNNIIRVSGGALGSKYGGPKQVDAVLASMSARMGKHCKPCSTMLCVAYNYLVPLY